ncbi:diadenosine 5',5'''-P1,P4-tetraphosphate phosphorylase 2 [[Candida] jaroonii]|uniref:Diadenosine 5',5'''-P1,P4-tetraphosphate phosphorylase 2 n=1 Tax=[Candida] jaroonii TaxID=467808 RepID=A0ACA9Y240_9ASCO|nr:diadenosine 5',5'''-P1,P4-tetraphosphate phosphorylase 2 [[Candida] jaroonii]
MFFPLPDNFFELLHSRYDQALADGLMKFNGDDVKNELLEVNLGNFTVNLQYSTIYSLMHRPEKGDFKANPFEDPEPELTIVENFGDKNQFRIVYNKFPVIPRHIMLLTKQFKPQTTPLSPDELVGSFTILKKLEEVDPNNKWFGFYNCGEDSGASQPHKHVQFMTLPEGFKAFPETIIEKSDAFIPNTKREPLQNANLPFAHFIAKFPSLDDMVEEDLIMYFMSLLQRTLTVLRENKSESISYNVVFTTDYMMIVPRSHGKYKDLGINSCGILGLFLFKNDELLETVKEDTPEAVWKSVGFPNTSGQESDEYHY